MDHVRLQRLSLSGHADRSAGDVICAKYAHVRHRADGDPVDLPGRSDADQTRFPRIKDRSAVSCSEMAEKCGYVFYIEPGPMPGTNIAYFGPEIKVGVPQPALNVDMDAHTNVESLSFNFDPSKGVCRWCLYRTH